MADEADDSTSEAAGRRAGTSAIEEIVVTARKREESLQDTPLSIKAFSETALQDQSIKSLTDVGIATPNLLFDTNISQYNPRVYIRGVGSDDLLSTVDPGVGVYVDGVYHARTVGLNLGLMDVRRVEVLRGPQGTLYGRNTIGGAINVVTSKPKGEWGTVVTAGVGNYDQLQTGLSVDFPIVAETLAGRLSLSSDHHGGFFDNKFDDADWANDRGLSGRLTLNFVPTDSSEFTLTMDRTAQRSHPYGSTLNSVCEQGTGPTASSVCQSGLIQGFLGSQVGTDPDEGSLDGSANSIFAAPGAPAGRSENNLDSWGGALTSTFDVGENSQIKLISSFRRLETREGLDVDSTSVSFIELRTHTDNKQFTQEVQFNGTFMDGRMKWVSGLYYFWEDSKTESASNQLSDATLVPFLPAFTAQALSTDTRTDQTVHSYAGFLNASYDLTDRLTLDTGLRYTYDHKHFKHNVTNKLGIPTTARDDTEHYNDWSPTVGLQYQLMDTALVYARLSRGFRGGGFNGRANDLNPLTTSAYDPEVVKVGEIGLKSSWFDDRLVMNLAAFQNNYKDIQLTTFTFDGARFVSLVQNAGRARVRGAEAEFFARPIDALDLSASFGLTHAKYLTFREPVLFPVAGVSDVSDRDFKNTPTYNFNLGAAYTFEGVFGGGLTVRSDYSFRSKVYYNTATTESISQNKVGLVNGRVSWRSGDDRMEVALWGKNLTDREWNVFGLDLTSSLGFTSTYAARPREYGVEVTLRY